MQLVSDVVHTGNSYYASAHGANLWERLGNDSRGRTLEGGYNVEALGRCVVEHVGVLANRRGD